MIDNVIKMIYKSTPKIWIGTEFIGKFVINLSDIIMNTLLNLFWFYSF